MKPIFLTTALLFLLTSLTGLNAQETWDLQKCITYAHENNLQVQSQLLQADLSKVNKEAAIGQMLPSLNGFASNSYNWGQRIDPFTNQFADTRVRSNNFFLSSNLTLFNGFQLMNSVRQSELDFKSATYDVDKTRNDIALMVATAYLNVLFNEELLSIAQAQLQQTQKQLDRTEKLVKAGSLAQGELSNIQAQFATEEVNVVQAENNLSISMLNLKQTMQLDASTPIRLARPTINIGENAAVESRPGQVYDQALRVLPEVKSAEYGVASSEKGVAIAKGAMSPSLSLNASYGTGYSGLATEVISRTEDGTVAIGFVEGSQETVFTPTFSTETQTQSFGDQFSNNLNQTLGINLNIPIFNGFSVRSNISRARINHQLAEQNLEATKNTIRQTIEQAYTDAVAALKQYRASEKSVSALQRAFNDAQKRYDVGMINVVDYNDTKTRLTRAESDLVRAKYDYIFKSKVLDFYQGRPIVLN